MYFFQKIRFPKLTLLWKANFPKKTPKKKKKCNMEKRQNMVLFTY